VLTQIMNDSTDYAPRKLPVVGVAISTTSYGEVVDVCRQWIDNRRARDGATPARYICVTSVHGIMIARDDGMVRQILNTADIATPDGMPIVWALRSFGVKKQTRVYGPVLMLHLCKNAEKHGHRIFLYGGREQTLVDLQMRLQAKFPDLQIVGSYSPPFRPLTDDEDRMVARQIEDSGAEIVFVGISTPKQEQWMYDHREKLPGVIMLGVGAAFDFHAGHVRQAPDWMQNNGLAWIFRLASDPRRLWQRYLLVTPRFLPLWAMQLMRGRANAAPRQA
jgi:N-acetylglucosaminyldiphosphoundecaprenol N-acetyl-beta-D-mannosaminyltransferase